MKTVDAAVDFLMDIRCIGTASLNHDQRAYETMRMREMYRDILMKALPILTETQISEKEIQSLVRHCRWAAENFGLNSVASNILSEAADMIERLYAS